MAHRLKTSLALATALGLVALALPLVQPAEAAAPLSFRRVVL